MLNLTCPVWLVTFNTKDVLLYIIYVWHSPVRESLGTAVDVVFGVCFTAMFVWLVTAGSVSAADWWRVVLPGKVWTPMFKLLNPCLRWITHEVNDKKMREDISPFIAMVFLVTWGFGLNEYGIIEEVMFSKWYRLFIPWYQHFWNGKGELELNFYMICMVSIRSIWL